MKIAPSITYTSRLLAHEAPPVLHMRHCHIPSFLRAEVDANVSVDMDTNISTNMDVDVSANMDANMDADIILAYFWKSRTDITRITCNKSKFSSRIEVFIQQ
jgi:hypothetical protein